MKCARFRCSKDNVLFDVIIFGLFLLTAITPVFVKAEDFSSSQVPQSSTEQAERLKSIEAEEHKLFEKRLHLIDLIFPKSSTWTRFQDLPLGIAPKDADKKLHMAMIAMGVDVKAEQDLKSYLPNFRKFSYGNHQTGLIYSGGIPGSEGASSFSWPNFLDRPMHISRRWPEVVRIREGENPAFTGWYTGCCADTTEAFYRAELLDADGAEIVRSSSFLKLPDGMIEGRFPIFLNLGCVVRYSPEVYDKPTEDNSDPLPSVGNIARKFAGIFDATVLAAFVDKNGVKWVLIQTTSMDDQASSYKDKGQLPVDIGWIDAKYITHEEENKSVLAWLEKLK